MEINEVMTTVGVLVHLEIVPKQKEKDVNVLRY